MADRSPGAEAGAAMKAGRVTDDPARRTFASNARQQRSHHLKVDRFDQMVIEAGLRGSSAVFLLTEAGGRNQERRPNRPFAPKTPGDLEAVHLGQRQVEK